MYFYPPFKMITELQLFTFLMEHPGYINTSVFVILMATLAKVTLAYLKRLVSTLERHTATIERLTNIVVGADCHEGLRRQVEDHEERISQNEKMLIKLNAKIERE